MTSPELKAKQELNPMDTYTDSEFKFNINKVMGKRKHKTPELWSLWYAELFGEIIDGFNGLISAPLPHDDTTHEDAFNSILDGLNTIINQSEKNLDADLSPLITMRSMFEKFMSGDTDEVTIVLENQGGSASVEVMNSYIEYDIKIDILSETENISEISTLRKHRSELTDEFNHYYNRPSNKYRRNLYISLKRTDKTTYASLWFDEQRTKPLTLVEKIELFLNSHFG